MATVIEGRTIVFEHELLAGIEHPTFEAHGARPGPRLSLIGGIHGCEYSSIAAVTRFMNELDTSELAGTITAVPVVSMESFRRRSPFVVPVDGKNLNRCFPGSYDGTYSDVLARSIFEELIAPADVLIDLHGGDLVEALEPFTIYDASPVEARAREIAIAFGLPYVVRQERQPADRGGMTCTAAAEAGIPAIIAEAGGRGQLERDAVIALVDGVGNVLRHLGMLPGEPSASHSAMRTVGSSVWLRCRYEGWWDPSVASGDEVSAGQQIGFIRNLFGEELETITAPADGIVLFMTTSPAVEADGLLLGVGADLGPLSA